MLQKAKRTLSSHCRLIAAICLLHVYLVINALSLAGMSMPLLYAAMLVYSIGLRQTIAIELMGRSDATCDTGHGNRKRLFVLVPSLPQGYAVVLFLAFLSALLSLQWLPTSAAEWFGAASLYW